MFGVEMASGFHAHSVSLIADAVDFLGDAANYGISLLVLALAPIWRPRTALIKGITMGCYGIVVLALTGWNIARGSVPAAETMGMIGLLALASNASVAALLYAYRNGDSDMRSVSLCSRNDAIGNVAVMCAALGVFGTGSGWPDVLVAGVMGLLGITAARTVIAHARSELRGQQVLGTAPSASAIELKRR